MSKDLVPFLEETYQNLNIDTFSINPNITIQECEHLFTEDSNIIEAGCGEGQNVLYLARLGYKNIDAFDISEYAVNKVKHKCGLMDVEINAFVEDLTSYQFEKNYDLVMSFGTLHFVSKEGWRSFIKMAKEKTNPKGIHIMQIFTDTVPASEDIAILSDIHSNHIALEACIDYIEKQNINNLIFLGDYVSNCAYPQKTMELIYKLAQEKKCWFVRGNREELLVNHANGADDGWTIPSTVSGSMLYTYNQLTEKDLQFFSRLNCSDCVEVQGFPKIAFCHGSMDCATGIIDETNAEQYFKKYQTSLILCGHTHVAGCSEYSHGKVINAGSVGTPVNDTGEAEFVILHGDADGWKEEFVTVPFDRMKVVEELEESGLIEYSKLFGRMVKELLVINKDRWTELIECAAQICERETGDTTNAMAEEYLEKAAEMMGVK